MPTGDFEEPCFSNNHKEARNDQQLAEACGNRGIAGQSQFIFRARSGHGEMQDRLKLWEVQRADETLACPGNHYKTVGTRELGRADIVDEDHEGLVTAAYTAQRQQGGGTAGLDGKLVSARGNHGALPRYFVRQGEGTGGRQ